MLKKKQVFDQAFTVYDALKAHETYNVKVLLATNKTNLVLVPADGTSRSQQLDVSINILFFRIRIEYGEILPISPYSVRMRENTDGTTPHTDTFYTV